MSWIRDILVRVRIRIRGHKTVQIKVFLIFLLYDRRIRIRTNNDRSGFGGPKAYGSGSGFGSTILLYNIRYTFFFGWIYQLFILYRTLCLLVRLNYLKVLFLKVRNLWRNSFTYVWSLSHTWYRYRFAEVAVPELLFRTSEACSVSNIYLAPLYGGSHYLNSCSNAWS